MTLHRWTDRVRRTLDERYYVAVVALIVLVTFAVGLTYATYAAVPAEERIDAESEFQHSATVEEENPVFETGSELEDRRMYFPAATPELDGEFIYTYETDGNADLDVETQIVIVTEEFDEDEEETLWRSTELLTSDESDLDPGEEKQVPFTIDMMEGYEEVEEIQDSFGDEWGTQMTVVAETHVSGSVDGQSVEMNEQHELPMEVDDIRYRVGEDESPDAGARGALLTPVGLMLVMRGIGVSLLVVSLVALAAIVVARQQNRLAPPARDTAQMTFEQQRQMYDEWISTGVLPDEYLGRSRIQVESLEELVNVAYDSDSRVINDIERNAYYVVAGETVYEFVPPHRETEPGEIPPAIEGDDRSESEGED